MPDSIMVPAQFSFTIRNSDLNNGSYSQIIKVGGITVAIWKVKAYRCENWRHCYLNLSVYNDAVLPGSFASWENSSPKVLERVFP